MKGDWRSRSPRCPIEQLQSKKFGKQTQLDQHVAIFFYKPWTNSYDSCSKLLLFFQKYEEMLTCRSQLLNTLDQGYARPTLIDNFLEVSLGTMPVATSILLVKLYMADATFILIVSEGTLERDQSNTLGLAGWHHQQY
jgi:hypothetical protein